MEYLTLLDYLYVITFNTRKRAARTVTFFLTRNLTVLNNLSGLKVRSSSHHSSAQHI